MPDTTPRPGDTDNNLLRKIAEALSGGGSGGGGGVVFQSELEAERLARIAGDNTLQTNINTEASTRAAADTTLQTNINTEASTRAAADTTLQTNIDAISIRGSVNITTGNLASGAQETGTTAVGKTVGIIKVSSADSFPFRLRLYSTAAARTADLSRSVLSLPAISTQHQVILDLVLNANTGFTWVLSPFASGSNGDSVAASNLYYTVDNLDTVSRVISIDILRLKLEP